MPQEGSSMRRNLSSGRRTGSRSHEGPGGRTRDQLYDEAKALDIPDRSKMSKNELRAAIDRRRGRRAF